MDRLTHMKVSEPTCKHSESQKALCALCGGMGSESRFRILERTEKDHHLRKGASKTFLCYSSSPTIQLGPRLDSDPDGEREGKVAAEAPYVCTEYREITFAASWDLTGFLPKHTRG